MKKGIIVVCLSVIFVFSWALSGEAQVDHLTYQSSGDGILHDVDHQGGDDNMCWAAAAANILDWGEWNNGYNDQYIYEHYFNPKTFWENKGGLMEYAWQWWFGKKLPCWLYKGYNESECQSCPGEWAKVSGSSDYSQEVNFSELYCYYGKLYDHDAMGVIKCLLEKGYGVTITIYDPNALSTDPGHALTVLGYRDDGSANETVASLLITDSAHDPDEMFLPVTYHDSTWRFTSGEFKDWLIESVHALKSHGSMGAIDDCDIKFDCAKDTRLAIVRKKCYKIDENGDIIPDENGEIKEVPCGESNNETIIVTEDKDSSIVINKCGSGCKRFIVSFSGGEELYVDELPDDQVGKVNYKLTYQSFEKLKKRELSEAVLNALKPLQDERYINEDVFWEKVKSTVEPSIERGLEENEKKLILNYARIKFFGWEIPGEEELRGSSTIELIETEDICPRPVIGCSPNG